MNPFRGLHFSHIRGDIYGGLTAAVVALPLALAFGVSSGAGPIAGIYGAIFVGFFAALFGGTRTQVSGPTGPMTVVMAGIFTHFVALDPSTGPAIAFTVVMMGGLFQILFGVLRLGKYINLMPHPVISGFMSGIGVIIILLQLGPLLGHETAGKPLASAAALPAAFTNPVMDAVILGVIALAIVYFLPKRINKLIPSPLLALLIGTLVLLLFMPNSAATILGDIPTGWPSPQLPTFEWSLFIDMTKSALVLALLGTIDSLLTSLVADNMTRTHHDSDRELIGQGIGNTIAGIFGGLPGAGATMRTVVNIRAGGVSPVSGALHALALLAIVLGAGAFAKYIPHAVLAGILIKVGTDIIDWDFIKRIPRTPKFTTGLMFAVLFTTVFVDLITAVAVGLVAASLLLVHRMSVLQLSSLKMISGQSEELPLSPKEIESLDATNGRTLLVHIEGPMSFGAAKGMARRLAGFNEYDALVLDLSDVPRIDFTSALAIEDIIKDAGKASSEMFIVGMTSQVSGLLNKLEILDKLATDHQCTYRIDALEHAAELLKTR